MVGQPGLVRSVLSHDAKLINAKDDVSAGRFCRILRTATLPTDMAGIIDQVLTIGRTNSASLGSNDPLTLYDTIAPFLLARYRS